MRRSAITVKLPGYARVDAAAFYKVMRGIEAQINVENIFGADYFPTAHSDNNIAPGAPTDDQGGAPLRLLASQLRGAVADSLEVVDEPPRSSVGALVLGDAQQEAGVDRHPAFAAVGKR